VGTSHAYALKNRGACELATRHRGPVNWAIVGCGAISDLRIAPSLNASTINRLAAVTSHDNEKAARFGRKHGVERVFPSLEALLQEPGLDAVYLATPNGLHAAQTLMACQAGKHVLCEKPMALTVADCEAMVSAAESHGVKLGIGFNFRYNPALRELRRLLAEGSIGQVLHTTARWGLPSGRSGWRLDAALAGGGVLMDMGTHLIDLLRFLVGREVVQVHALLDTATGGWPLDDLMTATLEFAGGVQGVLAATSRFAFVPNDVEVYGTAGSIRASGTLRAQLTETLPPVGHLEISTSAGTSRAEFAIVDLFRDQLDSFGRAILENREPEVVGRDGLRVQEVAAAIQESARMHKSEISA